MTYLLKTILFFRTDGRIHGRTDGQTNERTVRLYYAPNFIWGHKKASLEYVPYTKSAWITNYGV